jgi:hypothetical protein
MKAQNQRIIKDGVTGLTMMQRQTSSERMTQSRTASAGVPADTTPMNRVRAADEGSGAPCLHGPP